MWAYTPKQAAGFLWYAARRLKLQQAEQLSTAALAASGDGKTITKALKELQRQ